MTETYWNYVAPRRLCVRFEIVTSIGSTVVVVVCCCPLVINRLQPFCRHKVEPNRGVHFVDHPQLPFMVNNLCYMLVIPNTLTDGCYMLVIPNPSTDGFWSLWNHYRPHGCTTTDHKPLFTNDWECSPYFIIKPYCGHRLYQSSSRTIVDVYPSSAIDGNYWQLSTAFACMYVFTDVW